MGVVVGRYIDILSTRISSFFGSIIPISLFIFKMFFHSSYIELVDTMDELDSP